MTERHERIAEAVKTQPSRPLFLIAQDFGVSRGTLYRACEAKGVSTSGRPSRKWGEGRISSDTWLHVGDVLMENRRTRRQVEIIGVDYHEDLTVSYVCRAVSSFRKKRFTRIHERTVKSSYVRIKTTELLLPAERFIQWTFGHSN